MIDSMEEVRAIGGVGIDAVENERRFLKLPVVAINDDDDDDDGQADATIIGAMIFLPFR